MCKPPSPFATDTAEDILNGCYLAVMFAERLYLAGYRKQSGWISVEERLPERMKPVLVLATSRREDDGFDVLIAYHDRGEWEERSVHGDGGTVYAHVTHWMPLPEPPKGEKHDPA
jgi:hypothetical protein